MLLESSGYAVYHPDMGLSEYDGGPRASAPSSIWRCLSDKAHEYLDSPALIALHQPAGHLANLTGAQRSSDVEHFQWTYSELLSATERLAAYLSNCGIHKGDVLATFVENSAEWIVLLWASLRLGVIFTSQDPSVLNRRDELQAIIETVKPKAVVVINGLEAAKFKSQSQSWPCAVQLFCQSGQNQQLPEGWQLLSQISLSSEQSLPANDSAPVDTALIQYSSGSTSQAKACPHTFGSITAQIEGYRSFYGSDWASRETVFALTSKSFVAGCYLGCINTFMAGGSVVIPDFDFGAESTLKAVHHTNATHLMLVPSQVRALVSSPSLSKFRPASLKFVNISGDSIGTDLVEKAKVELKPKRIVHSWSMSEGGPVFGWQKDERVQLYNNVPMVGRALPGSQVKVCASRTGQPARFGEIGDLHVSSGALINKYMGDKNENSFYTENGRRWFITGDLAVMEEDGCVAIVGRSKDIINCSGWPLLPSLIEKYIKEFFGIESQAIGVPNPSTGEKPVAVIKVRKASIDLKQEMKQGLPRHQGSEYTLGAVYLLSELGLKDWPLGQTRKVSKDDLRSAVLERFPTKPMNGYPFSMYDMNYLEGLDYRF